MILSSDAPFCPRWVTPLLVGSEVEGEMVSGAAVGTRLGGTVEGCADGWLVGSTVGALDGRRVGFTLGLVVGDRVGAAVGRFVGDMKGLSEGSTLGLEVGH
jgi:hypothetical protein